MLEHALSIKAKEDYEAITIAMIPHLKKKERDKAVSEYLKRVDGDDSKAKVDNATIERDRKALKQLLLSHKK